MYSPQPPPKYIHYNWQLRLEMPVEVTDAIWYDKYNNTVIKCNRVRSLN